MKFKLNPNQKFRLQVAIFALEVIFTVLMYLALQDDLIVLDWCRKIRQPPLSK